MVIYLGIIAAYFGNFLWWRITQKSWKTGHGSSWVLFDGTRKSEFYDGTASTSPAEATLFCKSAACIELQRSRNLDTSDC